MQSFEMFCSFFHKLLQYVGNIPTDDDFENSMVIVGGGPVGLLYAIEASKHLSNVQLFEKRVDYYR